MIAYAIVLLTNLEDILTTQRIDVQCGTSEVSICGEMVRAFVQATNHAYHDYPFANCLECGLKLIQPEMQSIFEYLYETLKEVLVWNE